MKKIVIDYTDFIKMWNVLYAEHKKNPAEREMLEKLKHEVFLENELYWDEINLDEKEEEEY